MRHYTDDELILYHYGEGRRDGTLEAHLHACDVCASTYQSIADTLAAAGELDVPDRDDRYGLEVWQRIRHRLPVQEGAWWATWHRPAWAAAVVSLVGASFVAGQYWPRSLPELHAPVETSGAASGDAGARVRSAAIGDHLEQSGRMLLDLVNAAGPQVDVSGQQASAWDLVDANRLYRQAAERAGDDGLAGVLDELERHLLEIVHGPSTLNPAALERIRVRLDVAALLFKVRVLSDELRERELAPAAPRKTT